MECPLGDKLKDYLFPFLVYVISPYFYKDLYLIETIE